MNTPPEPTPSWRYLDAECAVPEKEMPAGSKRWAMSEKAKWSNGELTHSGK